MAYNRQLYILYSVILIAIWGWTEECVYASNRYRSDLLRDMSTVCGFKARMDTMSDGLHYRCLRYKEQPLTVRVKNKEVIHIGYAIFTPAQRLGMDNHVVADFVERYWLSLSLPLKREKSVLAQMVEDRFTVEVGGNSCYTRIIADTTLTVVCNMEMERRYTVEWRKGEHVVCRLVFPVNHELILGRNMLENDRRFVHEIKATQPWLDSVHVSEQLLAPVENRPYREANHGYYLLNVLLSNRYYIVKEGEWKPLYDKNFRQQTISNLFTGTDIPEAADFVLTLRQQTYNYTQCFITTTLHQFVCYCIEQGCQPYVGITRDDGKAMDVVLIMRNVNVGYNHVARLKVNTENLANGKGEIHGRLNAFVPTANIKNLFDDL